MTPGEVCRHRPAWGDLEGLRERWRAASLAAGWPFPNDWAVVPVDEVCEVVLRGEDVLAALAGLGAARSDEGADLSETLLDVAALYSVSTDAAVTPDTVPASWVRAVSEGWADAAAAQVGRAKVADGLTGLATTAYLRTRLAEVYESCAAQGAIPGDRYALVIVAVDFAAAPGWAKQAAMVLIGQTLPTAFSRGETRALLSPSTAAVLTERDQLLPARTARLRELATDQLAVDPMTRAAGPVRVWVEPLPDDYDAACGLISHLGR
ncbi:GGDEF domain-containing protein [Amycolatopsis anabasis]|uniref:GGDEF domain-containing protein n=1 Tax=Amycolatopsis anabasis TaxID=1840409 RepID=UPI001FE5DA9F|nr:GGDEF domain-containing protein [Amycolatopsis anabasis]